MAFMKVKVTQCGPQPFFSFPRRPASPDDREERGEEEEKEFFDYLIGRPMLASGGTS